MSISPKLSISGLDSGDLYASGRNGVGERRPYLLQADKYCNPYCNRASTG